MSKIIRALFNNFFIKFLSLAIAILLWNNIQRSTSRDIVLKLPIEYVNLKPNYILLEAPKTVNIIFTSESELSGEISGTMKVIVDLATATIGENKIILTKQNVQHSPKMKIKKISPNNISVFIDIKITKELPIKPIIIGSPADGFFLSDYWTIPKTAKVIGPKSFLDRLTFIPTEPVNIDGLDQTVTKIVALNITQPNIEIIMKKPIKIVLSVLEKEAEKSFEIPVTGFDSKLYKAEPRKVFILISGQARVIKNISEKDLQAIVKIRSQHFKGGKVAIRPVVPDNVKLISVTPQFVNLYPVKK